MTVDRLEDRARALREDFDRSFSEPREREEVTKESFVTLRIGGDGHALRVAELSGLHSGKKIVALPSPSPELLGISGMRSGVVPVYCLEALLGYPRTTAPAWLVLAGVEDPIGLAFESFEGHSKVASSALFAVDPGAARTHVRELVRIDGEARRVVDVASMTSAIRARVLGVPKER